MGEKTTKLNVPYIKELLRSKGMDIKMLSRYMGYSPGAVKQLLEQEFVDIQIAERMSGCLNVGLLEIVTAY